MVKDQELNRLFQLYQSKQACEQELEAWHRWIEERIEELQEQRSVLVHENYQFRNLVVAMENNSESVFDCEVALVDLNLQIERAYEREGNLRAKRLFCMNDVAEIYDHAARVERVEKAKKLRREIDWVNFKIRELERCRRTLLFAKEKDALNEDWYSGYVLEEYRYLYSTLKKMDERLKKLRRNLRELEEMQQNAHEAVEKAKVAWAERLKEIRRQKRASQE